jgi:hypothetical protein
MLILNPPRLTWSAAFQGALPVTALLGIQILARLL